MVTQVVKQLASPLPFDLDDVDLRHYRELERRWQDWRAVRHHLVDLAARTGDALAEKGA